MTTVGLSLLLSAATTTAANSWVLWWSYEMRGMAFEGDAFVVTEATDPRVNLTLARAYKALGQRDRALDRAESALKVNPHLNEATRLRDELRR